MHVFGRPVVQVAYHVPNVEAAARDCAKRFGWGPFFLAENVSVPACAYRGNPARFDHTSAYGQAGDVMVELIAQADDAPSVLRERFAADQRGVHHVAVVVDDLDAFLAEAGAAGCATALDARTDFGLRFAMVDALDSLGVFVEAYSPSPPLDALYAMVRAASLGWDGADPVRRLG
jgi:hypothetical protein